MQRIEIIDSHTGGEPTRVVIAGFPDLGTGTMAERREVLARDHDRWRRATLLEPRGSEVLVGALLCAPQDPAHAAGVIFFNNASYHAGTVRQTERPRRTVHVRYRQPEPVASRHTLKEPWQCVADFNAALPDRLK